MTNLGYMPDNGVGALVGVSDQRGTVDGDEATVDTPCVQWQEMMDRWDPIMDLMGGTQRMREVGDKWLPQMEGEEDGQYRVRLAGSFLETLYEDTIDKLTSKPFSRRVEFKKDGLSEEMQAFLENVDMAGSSIHDFAEQWYRDGLMFGVAHALVDFSFMPDNITGRMTRGEERAAGARPTMVRVSPLTLFNWRETTDAAGKRTLTQARIIESRYEPSGPWGEELVQYIRVFTPETVQLWRKGEKDEEFEADSDLVPHTFGRVPIVSYYTARTGFMTADPPFEGLAWVNIDHWQSYSDQRNILHVARVPILLRTGVPEEEMKKNTFIGAGREIKTTNENADAKYVEVSGTAMSEGEKHLQGRDDRAARLGSQPRSKKSPMTATGVVADDSMSSATLQNFAHDEELGLEEGVRLAAEHSGESLPDDFRLSIHKDFDLGNRSNVDLAELGADYDRGVIEPETYLVERKARGLYRPAFDPAAEIKSIGVITPRGMAAAPMNGTNVKRNGADPAKENPLAARADT